MPIHSSRSYWRKVILAVLLFISTMAFASQRSSGPGTQSDLINECEKGAEGWIFVGRSSIWLSPFSYTAEPGESVWGSVFYQTENNFGTKALPSLYSLQTIQWDSKVFSGPSDLTDRNAVCFIDPRTYPFRKTPPIVRTTYYWRTLIGRVFAHIILLEP